MGSGGSNSGDSVQERVLSTLLNEMDGVETAESVLVVVKESTQMRGEERARKGIMVVDNNPHPKFYTYT